jgi:putative flippase GtrA
MREEQRKTMAVFYHTLFRFMLVGMVNTLVGSTIMFLLYNAANMGYWFSSAANYVIGSVLSFFLNKYFTFNVRQWSAYMVITFILTIAFSYLVAYGISKPAVNLLLKDSPQKMRENIALFIGMCLFTGINYLGQRFMVFRVKAADSTMP